MTYDYYLKQPLPMCEVKLNQILAKNLRLKYRLKKFQVIHTPENSQIKR